jgi:hypothetical protein
VNPSSNPTGDGWFLACVAMCLIVAVFFVLAVWLNVQSIRETARIRRISPPLEMTDLTELTDFDLEDRTDALSSALSIPSIPGSPDSTRPGDGGRYAA